MTGAATPATPRVGADQGRPDDHREQVTLVGPGFHLLGGLSVYTCRMAQALTAEFDVSVLLLHKVIPSRFYPGGHRAGQSLSSLSYPDTVPVRARINFYGGLGLARAVADLVRRRPDLLVLQWWTAATLHIYLVLALAARLARVPVVIEFHETQDTGEAGVPLVARYCRTAMPLLLRLTSGALAHSEHDVDLLRSTYGGRSFDRLALDVAPHGPYDHLEAAHSSDTEPDGDPGVTSLLFFGLIRPYKGLEDLIRAFDALSPAEVRRFRLTVVGETWENWTLPAELIAASPHAERIRFVNRYVSDAEAATFYAGADAVVLPYRRGSASGPLQIAMSHGLHVLLYSVGGLVEAVRNYPGARLVAPNDVAALTEAIRELPDVREARFTDPHSWQPNLDAVGRLTARLRLR